MPRRNKQDRRKHHASPWVPYRAQLALRAKTCAVATNRCAQFGARPRLARSTPTPHDSLAFRSGTLSLLPQQRNSGIETLGRMRNFSRVTSGPSLFDTCRFRDVRQRSTTTTMLRGRMMVDLISRNSKREVLVLVVGTVIAVDEQVAVHRTASTTGRV